jgi:hypothetical protein
MPPPLVALATGSVSTRFGLFTSFTMWLGIEALPEEVGDRTTSRMKTSWPPYPATPTRKTSTHPVARA